MKVNLSSHIIPLCINRQILQIIQWETNACLVIIPENTHIKLTICNSLADSSFSCRHDFYSWIERLQSQYLTILTEYRRSQVNSTSDKTVIELNMVSLNYKKNRSFKMTCTFLFIFFILEKDLENISCHKPFFFVKYASIVSIRKKKSVIKYNFCSLLSLNRTFNFFSLFTLYF